ncbi:MAG: class I SAM-dependent methyltransferase [Hyphomicrobiaceae bacterium TMED74]|nr:hypothetical protein [Filomicrobium sp.]RPG38756.1 MAG: class I SAM-dependent methyltransferase [Hyphomicrobiaceae bacterium TMED74]
MSDAQTIAAYNKEADRYAELAKTDPAQEGLTSFLELVPIGGLVLDLGCGPGHTAAEMVRRGYLVEALDASAEMARLAKELHGIDVQICDFANFNAVGRFDGVWASFSLLHAAREDFPVSLANINRSLKPNGALFLGMKLGAGDERDKLGRHYIYYSEPELVSLLADAGFETLTRTLGQGLGLAGRVEPWITIISKRPN